MRWTSHDFGKVPPDKFIPIVENAGLISYLGKWALRYSCHQLRRFQEKMPDFVMSVNVSPLQFCADDFVLAVIEGLEEANVDPATLILEITESTLMHSQEKTERALTVLRDRGVRFSIDDFGTGFSSLAYLTRLPVSSMSCLDCCSMLARSSSAEIGCPRFLLQRSKQAFTAFSSWAARSFTEMLSSGKAVILAGSYPSSLSHSFRAARRAKTSFSFRANMS